MKVGLKFAAVAASALAVLAAGFVAGRAGAAGIPAQSPLTYSGLLQDGTGAPLIGPIYIAIQLWDDATSTAPTHLACTTGDPSLTPLVNGRFSMVLPDKCSAAVSQSPSLFVDVIVGTSGGNATSLGPRSKLGVVPYALEAGNASQLGGKPSTEYQARMTSTCPAGHAIAELGEDGAPTCIATITAWRKFTPTVVTNTAGFPAITGIDSAKSKGAWRRVGENIEISISTQFSSASTDGNVIMWRLPDNLSPVAEFADSVGGTAELWDGTQTIACLPAGLNDSIGAIILDCAGRSTLLRSDLGPKGSGKVYAVGIHYTVPITGWSLTSP